MTPQRGRPASRSQTGVGGGLPFFIALFLLINAAACSPTQPEIRVVPSPTGPVQPLEASDTPLASPDQPVSTPTVQEVVIPTATQSATSTGTPAPTETPTPTPPPSFPNLDQYGWQILVDGLANPVGLANAGDGSGRLFVLEQAGVVKIIRNGQVLAEPFLDITRRVGCCGERGLLGLAFHPDYEENGFFFVNYTDRRGDTVIARFSTSQDPDRAVEDSEVRLLDINQPYGNHNGGVVVFGPDGYLYLGLGDGGSAGDPHNNGQSLHTLLGKILRLDVNWAEPYAIPWDNPFVDTNDSSALPEIWAYGLRNPWRMSFDRLTGDLYIGDVGQGKVEEINFLPAGNPGGVNFGWNFYEGSLPYKGDPPPEQEMIAPVAEYDHSQGCSVTGGVVYRGEELQEWQGIYLYGDYCSGKVWGLIRNPDGTWQESLLFESGARITSFGEDEIGEVYLVDYQGLISILVKN
jgi:glucose/arabinose dehydrogenase